MAEGRTEFVHYVVTVSVKKVTKSYPPADRYKPDVTVEPRREVEDLTQFSTSRSTLAAATELVTSHLTLLDSED